MADVSAVARLGFELDDADFFVATVLHDFSDDFRALDRRRSDFRVFAFVVRDEERVKFDGVSFGFVDFFGGKVAALFDHVLFAPRFNNGEHIRLALPGTSGIRGRTRLNYFKRRVARAPRRVKKKGTPPAKGDRRRKIKQ